MTPVVSLGLPVYNGANYVSQAISSVLGQTFEDFELVISDNCSTDDTERICREMAAADPRVRYVRQAENRGAAPNFNLLVPEARGRYFKWVSHDDELAPTFLQRCVEVLDDDLSCTVAMSGLQMIDENGQDLGSYRDTDDAALASTNVVDRFRELARLDYACFDVFGLIRLDALRRTKLIDDFVTSDRSLLVDLGLRGRFLRVPEPLFLPREHTERSTRALRTHERMQWWNSSRADRFNLPRWRLAVEYGRIVARSDVSRADKVRCWRHLSYWVPRNSVALGKDLLGAAHLAVRRVRSGH